MTLWSTWPLALCALGACSFQHGSLSNGGGDDAAVGDAARAIDTPDGPPDAPPDAYDLCLGAGLVPQICLTTPPPTTPQPALGATFDTTANAACTYVPQTAGPMLCVIEAQTIAIETAIVVTGDKPFVLFATDTITVDAAIDVSSHYSPPQTGAGANWSSCVAATAPGVNNGGSGGAAGGSFGANGANGGTGNNTSTPAAGGIAAMQTAPTTIHGGCPGDTGAAANGTAGGRGGDSGGAVYLLAGTSITVGASIAANGAGGGPGNSDSGGGGGGAGGMIGLEAPTITIGAVVAANGGGGGGGGINSPAESGGPGGDGQISTTTAATGGVATVDVDTHGGAGGVGSTAAVAGNPNTGGGGGGGGAVGVIYTKSTNVTGAAMCSPAPTPG